MELSFVRRKFNAMLCVSTVTMSINYLVMLSGTLIAGNLVGPEGLAGVNVCSPALGVASFFSALLSVGSGLVFSRAMGAFEERRAAGVFTMSMAVACLFSLVIGLVAVFGGDAFMNFSGITGEVRRQAQSYWNWQAIAVSLMPFVLLLEALVYADGDCVVAAAAGACHVVGSIVLSIVFTMKMGTVGGISAGMSLAMVLVVGVASLHFLRGHNHLKFVRSWSKKDLLATFAGSMPDASIYLCWAVLILAINQVVVHCYDHQLLAIVALAVSITEFSIVFDGVGEVLIPLGGMYAGEGNLPALRKLANYSALVATLEGVICAALLWIFAPVIAPVFGIYGDAAKLLPEAVSTIRAMAFAMPAMGFLMMVNTHYLVVGHGMLAVSVTFVKDLIFPCIGALPFGLSRFEGLWWGFSAGFVLAVAYPFVFVRLKYGKRYFPWLIPSDDGLIKDITVRLTSAGVASACERIGRYLSKRAVSDGIAEGVRQTIEDSARISMEGEGSASAIVEYAVFLNRPEEVRLIARDTGRTVDMSRRLSPPRPFAHCRYLNTLNCNRSEYVFRLV